MALKHNLEASLTIVANPNSTRHSEVESQVFDPLERAKIPFGVYLTRYPESADNVRAMKDELPDDGMIIVAGGDGTAKQLAEVAISKKDLTLGFFPGGSFNDAAYSHMDRGDTICDLIKAPTIEVYPLSVEMEIGEERRSELALSYLTLGMTALVAAGFDAVSSRKQMTQMSQRKRSVSRLMQAGKDYVKNRDYTLPQFEINNVPSDSKKTDIAIANRPIVAGMIRPPESYYGEHYFGVNSVNIGNVLEAISFGTRSLIGKSPLERMYTMRILFENASNIPMQMDGEYQELIGAGEVFIYKNPENVLKILHSKRKLFSRICAAG